MNLQDTFARNVRPDLRPGALGFYAAALLALFCLHTLALWTTFDQGLGWAMIRAVAPTASIAALGPALRSLLLRAVFRFGAGVQTLAHLVLAALFTMLLYWFDLVLIGVLTAGNPVRFAMPDFFAPAAAWQMVYGVAMYGLVALSAYAGVLRARLEATPALPPLRQEPEGSSRLFVRHDEEFRPLDPARIILARGADDYAEIVTAAGAHLVRMTLSTLGDKLGSRFIRVHRSCLVNVDHVAKAEPAGGGRMLLHMDNGAVVTTSRAGARLLRESIV